MQHNEPIIRKSFILSNSKENFKETLKATEIGEFLFEKGIIETVRSSKLLESVTKT